MLVLKTSLFCGISERASWKQWLKNAASDLHFKLIETQRQTSCRKNTAVMKEIRAELYERNLGTEFEAFIHKNFPMVIDRESSIVSQQVTATPAAAAKPLPQQRTMVAASTNKHNVFKNYRAGLLTFPHKKIFVNQNKQQLEAIVQSFLRDKIGTDYIIVEDYAYIEYFNQVYSNEVEKVPKESRDIYQYRLKNGNK